MNNSKPIALVTGGNRGIGYEMVKHLSLLGIKVILTSRDREKGQRAVSDLDPLGTDIMYLPMDVNEQESIQQAADWVKQEFGKLDILINNAGVYLDEEEFLLTMNPAILENTLKTNFLAPYHVTRSFITLMEKQNYGRIVNISSGYGSMGQMMEAGVGAYKISKLALNGLTQLIAAEVKGNIKINAVCPGWVKTDMGGPLAPRSPEQAVKSMLWLALLPDDGPSGGFFRDGQQIPW